MDFVPTSQQSTLVRITVLLLTFGLLFLQLLGSQTNMALASADTNIYLPTILETSSTHAAAAAAVPAQVLNLTNWKITLPIGSSGSPTEIKQPQLATFQIDPWFIVAPSGIGVRFRAPVNGVTTSGSSYPRSELREMTNSGKTNAAWSSTSGTHTMVLDEAFTVVPQTKRQVVGAQIHDSSDDIMTLRLEYPTLYVNVQGKNVYTLDANYTLGKRFTAKFVVSGGQTKVYYNGSANPIYTLSESYSGAYFKAGAYTQSNCSKEGSSSLCNNNNYGEVVLYNLTVTHQ